MGVRSPDLYQNQVLYIKKDLRGLHHLLAMRPADIYDPFFLITKKLIFSKGVFLKPGTTLQIKLHSYRVRV